MKQKVKIYRMSISKVFPATHPRARENTFFREKIMAALGLHQELRKECFQEPKPNKLHTCRSNYELWKKRIDEVNAGNAVLVLYEWKGKPYSKDGTNNLFVFGNEKTKGFMLELENMPEYENKIFICDSKLGIQKLTFEKNAKYPSIIDLFSDGKYINYLQLSNNDGLSMKDFEDWFKRYDLSKPMAIIHFTNFRY